MDKVHFSINVEYDADKYPERDSILDKLAKSFRGKSSGSGMGFGIRDIEYDFTSLKMAEKFYKDARKKKLINKEFFLHRWQKEWSSYRVNFKDELLD